jgi:hypothetical protein
MGQELGGRTNRAADEFAAAISANEPKLFRGAVKTIGALECADVNLAGIRRQILVTAFAIGTEFKGHAVRI